MLGGHLDTVPPNDNQSPHRDGDVLHGLGSADMKGGLAVLLTLAEALQANPSGARFDVTLVFYAAEEIADEYNGLRQLFAERPAWVAGDLAVLLEPTDGWVEAGCQGTLHLRATFVGERAHSARPWMGANAIHKAADGPGAGGGARRRDRRRRRPAVPRVACRWSGSTAASRTTWCPTAARWS